MIEDLVVLNQASNSNSALEQDSPHWVEWQTCVRRIYFGSSQRLHDLNLNADDKLYRGEDAYRFCMEVICGLHSPIVGETQVFGQFKQLMNEFDLCPSPLSKPLRDLLLDLSNDCKKVRQTHLRGLGSQSYGSVVRRKVKHLDEVNFIGAGILVQEIVPYMVKLGIRVRIHCRTPARVADVYRQYPDVVIEQLNDAHKSMITGALVIAAPLNSSQLMGWLGQMQNKLDKVVDLRGDSHTDAILAACDVDDLAKVFREIENTKQQLADRIYGAKNGIGKILKDKRNAVQVRPFGWEDIY